MIILGFFGTLQLLHTIIPMVCFHTAPVFLQVGIAKITGAAYVDGTKVLEVKEFTCAPAGSRVGRAGDVVSSMSSRDGGGDPVGVAGGKRFGSHQRWREVLKSW